VPVALVTVVVLGCVGAAASPVSEVRDILPDSAAATAEDSKDERAFALVSEFDRLAKDDLWPGFDPQSIPLAIFDGERTFLFRHPAPPQGFQPVAGRDEVWVFDGRHPTVSANSSAEMGGIETATLLLDPGDGPLEQQAGTLIHETFHVYQRKVHPAWSANEVDLFTYPSADAELLTLRRLEIAGLRRALEVSSSEESACWARAALAIRAERFRKLPAKAIAYERGSELNEGLATYVQRRASGMPRTEGLGGRAFGPDEVRQRSYDTGWALGALLDRFSASWRGELDSGAVETLEVALGQALGEGAQVCGISGDERERAESDAVREVMAFELRREARLRSFLGREGWSILVDAEQAPLFPQGFDPLNVQLLGGGKVLHTRFVQLGGELGSIEVIGRAALTEAAGAHPLFDGVRSLRITGLTAEPSIVELEDRIQLSANGVRAEFTGANVERSGATVIVRVEAPN